MKNVLLLNGHQRYEGFAEGKLNQTLTETAEDFLTGKGYEVKTTIVDFGYDIAEEHEKYPWADVVIVQTPVYWMSVPYLFKKYIDEVFTSAVGKVLWNDDGRTRTDPAKKYGSGGLMHGKKYMVSTTWNAPNEAFDDPGQFFKGKDVDDVFLWLHKNFEFFGMEALPSFSCHDVLKNAEVEKDIERYKVHLAGAFNS